MHEQWIIKNKTNKVLTVSDIPRLPVLFPGDTANLLQYSNREEIAASENLNTLFKSQSLTLRKIGPDEDQTISTPSILEKAVSPAERNDISSTPASSTDRLTSTSNAPVYLLPGIGAVQRSITGNSRGSEAVDLQNTRSDDTQVASGIGSFIAGGQNNKASGNYSFSTGDTTSAVGTNSHAEGNNTYAFGNSAHAEGSSASVIGDYSHSENSGICIGKTSHAEGQSTVGFQSTFCSSSLLSGTLYRLSASGKYTDRFVNGDTVLIYSSVSTTIGNVNFDGSNTTFEIDDGNVHEDFFTNVYPIGRVQYGHAENSSLCQAIYAHSEGRDTTAIGSTSHVEGEKTTTLSKRSHAEGYYSCTTEGEKWFAINYEETPLGVITVAGDITSYVSAGDTLILCNEGVPPSFSEVTVSTVTFTDVTTITTFNTTTFTMPVSFVNKSYFPGSFSSQHAQGYATVASGDNAHSSGYLTIASGDNSWANGLKNIAAGNQSFTSGIFNNSVGNNSSTLGIKCSASGSGCLSLGKGSHAGGRRYDGLSYTDLTKTFEINGSTGISAGHRLYLFDGSSAFGPLWVISSTESMGVTSVVISKIDNDDALLDISGTPFSIINSDEPLGVESSIATGFSCISTGSNSHSEGNGTLSSGPSAHAEGQATIASGQFSHAEGSLCIASGQSSHAGGSSCVASGQASYAGGSSCVASDLDAFVHGTVCYASGFNSCAVGQRNTAYAHHSFVAGENCSIGGEWGIVSGLNCHAVNKIYDIISVVSNVITVLGDISSEVIAGHLLYIRANGIAWGDGGGWDRREVSTSVFSTPNTLITLIDKAPSVVDFTGGWFADISQSLNDQPQAPYVFGTDSVVTKSYGFAIGSNIRCDSISLVYGYDAQSYIDHSIVLGSTRIAAIGDSQTYYAIRNQITTDSNFNEVSGGSFGSYITIPVNKTIAFSLTIVGRQTSGAKHAMYKRSCLIYNNAGTTALQGTVNEDLTIESDAAWDVQITADDTNDRLKIEVKGSGSSTYWVVKVEGVEVGY